MKTSRYRRAVIVTTLLGLSVFTFEYAGQEVHYCGCPYCQEGFQKDPSYYIKRLEGTIPSEGVVGHDGASVRP